MYDRRLTDIPLVPDVDVIVEIEVVEPGVVDAVVTVEAKTQKEVQLKHATYKNSLTFF